MKGNQWMEDRKGLCTHCKKRKTCLKLCPRAQEWADQDQVSYLLHGGRIGTPEEIAAAGVRSIQKERNNV